MATATNHEDLIGYQIKETCPICKKGKLFTNKRGNKWCTDIDGCGYHADKNGKPRNISEVARRINVIKDDRY